MSWLELFRVEAEKRNAETAVVIRDALAAEEVRKAEEAARKAEEQKRIEDEARQAEESARQARIDAYNAREKIRKAKWRENNRDKARESVRRCMLAHPERYSRDALREYHRKWMAAHPGRNAQYQKAFREKMKALRIAKGEKK